MAESTGATAPLLTGRFQRAFAVAGEVHAAQLRKGTRIPYLAHVMSVAALVLEYGGGEDAAIGVAMGDWLAVLISSCFRRGAGAERPGDAGQAPSPCPS